MFTAWPVASLRSQLVCQAETAGARPQRAEILRIPSPSGWKPCGESL